jgi:peptide/nickel transport system substrate-binding protein
MSASSYWNGPNKRVSRRRLILRSGAATAGILGLNACTPSASVPPPAASTAPSTPAAGAPAAAASPFPTPVQAKRGGVWRWASTSGWPHVDPHLTNVSSVFGYGIGACWNRLLKLKLKDVQLPAFIPTADLAESWDQPDDLTYVFRLRRNVKWQNVPPVNGREFLAADVVYSLDRMRTKDPAFVNASVLQSIAKLEAPDKSTIKIAADKPSADFLLTVGSPLSVIVAKEAVDLKGDLKEGPMVGTGAFIVEKLDPQGTSTARRNPEYFLSGLPYVDRYEYTVVPDVPTSIAAFRADNLEQIAQGGLTPKEAEEIKKSKPGAQIVTARALGSGTEIGLKLNRKPFDDIRVRRAIYMAFDAQTVMDTVAGSGWLSVGLPLPSVEWALPQPEISRRYKRDLEGAKRLLKEAGHESGIDFKLSVFNASYFPGFSELILEQWKEAGIRATIELLDQATFGTRVRGRGEFEASLGSGVQNSSADAELFGKYHSKGSNNVTGINDPRLDQMIEQQTTLGRDPEARKKLLLDIQRYILDQAYIHFIHTYDAPLVLQSYVRDFFPGFGGLALESDRWSLVWLDK